VGDGGRPRGAAGHRGPPVRRDLSRAGARGSPHRPALRRFLLQRIAHGAELFALLEQELRKWTTADLVERARRFGVPLAPAHDVAGFLADPQVVANGTVFEAEDGAAGRLRLLRSPVRFAATPSRFARRPPRLGEHGDEVLRERGFSAAEIAALRSAGLLTG
jgi:formyl-CoA transferase